MPQHVHTDNAALSHLIMHLLCTALSSTINQFLRQYTVDSFLPPAVTVGLVAIVQCCYNNNFNSPSYGSKQITYPLVAILLQENCWCMVCFFVKSPFMVLLDLSTLLIIDFAN